MRKKLFVSLITSDVVLHGPHQMRVRVEEQGSWRDALTQVLNQGHAVDGAVKLDVQVQLGLQHARVAVMTIDQPQGLMSIPASKHEQLVHAWAADMLHISPAEQVIRWRALADPRKVLVSSVNRALVQEIEQACSDCGARLASCRPAVLSAIDAARESAHDLTIIWTEDGADGCRHGAVQLLAMRARNLAGSWRGWHPAKEVESDDAFDEITARFESESDMTANVQRRRFHWPTHTGA